MVGPITKPMKRSTPVQTPPPATWRKVSAHVQLPAIEATMKTTTAPTIGSPFSGTIDAGIAGR